MKEFIEEFYRLAIKSGQTNEGEEAVTRYVNGIEYAIKYELILLKFRKVRETYHLTQKEEEKLSR